MVTTARGVVAAPVAEFVLAAILAQAKRLPELWIDDPARWRPTPWLAMVQGSVLGLFGFGAIGEAMAHVTHLVVLGDLDQLTVARVAALGQPS